MGVHGLDGLIHEMPVVFGRSVLIVDLLIWGTELLPFGLLEERLCTSSFVSDDLFVNL